MNQGHFARPKSIKPPRGGCARAVVALISFLPPLSFPLFSYVGPSLAAAVHSPCASSDLIRSCRRGTLGEPREQWIETSSSTGSGSLVTSTAGDGFWINGRFNILIHRCKSKRRRCMSLPPSALLTSFAAPSKIFLVHGGCCLLIALGLGNYYT